MAKILFIAALVAMIGAVASFIFGTYVMTKGGDINKKYSNKMMQARVFLQGLAIGLLFFAYLLAAE